MIGLVRKTYWAILFLTAAVFLSFSLIWPKRQLVPPDPLSETTFQSALERAREEIDTVVQAYRAASSVISGAGSETLALANFIVGQNKNIPLMTAIKQAGAFIRYSRIYDIPLNLAVAVANTESHFRPDAKSSHGSAGVMQVTWRVHKEALLSHGFKGKEELHDPVMGIKAGCLILSMYIRNTGNLKVGLGRYYGGSADVYWRRIQRNIKRYEQYEKRRTQTSLPVPEQFPTVVVLGGGQAYNHKNHQG